MTGEWVNRLYYGDNLDVLRHEIAPESVDLIYLDPPFNSDATYNVLFKTPNGRASSAQVEAFVDSWHWGESAEQAFDDTLRSNYTITAELIRSFRRFLGDNDLTAYLAMMAIRLIELHRVLKPTGSLYLHCDPTASHYLKLILDSIFSIQCFRNEIVWKRTFAHGASKRYGPVHDVILFYSRGANLVWTDLRTGHDPAYVDKHFRHRDPANGRPFQAISLTGAGERHGDSGKPWRGIDPTVVSRHWALPSALLARLGIVGGTIQDRLDALDQAGLIFWPAKVGGTPRLKLYADELAGVALPDVWTDIPPIGAHARERLGYPTQKPLALLERIIKASSHEGDVVLDPFCGCGTSIHVAEKLRRRWIGIDVTHLAIALIERRLQDAFPGSRYEVVGTPKDLDGALELARRNKYQFQWWAVGQVGARPYGGKKKGADRGIDGILYFRPDGKTTEAAIVSVKGGETVGVDMVRQLHSVIVREDAKIGVLITAALPTRAMESEAAAVGFFDCDAGRFPRLQIITLAELFQGKRPRIPLIDPSATFRAAPREDTDHQTSFDV